MAFYKPSEKPYKRPPYDQIVGEQTQNIRLALERLDEYSQVRLIVKILNLAKQKLKPYELDRLAKSIQSTSPLQELGKCESATQTDPPPTTQTSITQTDPQPTVQTPTPKPDPLPSRTSVPREPTKVPEPNNRSKKNKINIPPITVTNRDQYKTLLKTIKDNDIKITQFNDTAKGLRIFPETLTDHKAIMTLLDKNDTQYYTHDLPEDKTLRVVVRGVVGVISPTELCEELTELGFEIINVSQMHRRSANGEKDWLPLALVHIKKTDKSNEIFKLNHIRQIKCKIEPQRRSKYIAQCHRCQTFGHSQTHCKLEPRCVKCSEKHFAHECQKPDNTPPTCANCGLSHPANYKGCKAYPNKTKPVKKLNNFKSINRPALVNSDQSYASVTAKTTSKDRIIQQITDLLKQLIN